MNERDLDLLRCPETGDALRIAGTTGRGSDGEILDGTLESDEGRRYPVRDGIPRFVELDPENPTWDYKWSHLDRGQGLNYRIIDRDDPAYEIHDLFDRNSHGGRAFAAAEGGLALDVGCGVGQYTVRLLQEHMPDRVVALDLSAGVDVFRRILAERYPELLDRVLIVQGSALALPFAAETFDYVFSLGVLMHTGHTREAIAEVGRVTRGGGQVNLWIYASEPVPYEARESGRTGLRTPFAVIPRLLRHSVVWAWIRLFRLLPERANLAILRAFSSGAWYRLSTTRVFRRFSTFVFPTVMHPDPAYRLINNYDGYRNEWSDTWNEHEIWPTLREVDLVPLGFSDWRLGVWAVKRPGFYVEHVRD
jgi:SAM-dependent methyltransferase